MASGEVSSDLVIVLEKWINEAKLGDGLLTNMSPRVFLQALIRLKHKPRLIDLKKNVEVSNNVLWKEILKVMKEIFRQVTFSVSALEDTDEKTRASEKAKLALAIYYAAKLENLAPTVFTGVTNKWSGAPARTLKEALKILDSAKCHGTIDDHVFQRAFDPRIPPASSARKPPVPRQTFAAPRVSSVLKTRRVPDAVSSASTPADQGRIIQLETQLAAARAAHTAAMEEMGRVAAQNAQLQTKFDELRAAVNSETGSSSELKSVAARLVEEITADRSTRATADAVVLDLSKKLESALSISETCAVLKMENFNLRRDLDILESRLNAAENERSDAAMSADVFREEADELKRDLALLQMELTVTSARVEEIDREKSSAESACQLLRTELDNLRQQLVELRVEKGDADASVESANHKEEALKQTLVQVSADCERLRNERDELEGVCCNQLESIEKLKLELEDKSKTYSGIVEDSRKELEAISADAHEAQSKLLQDVTDALAQAHVLQTEKEEVELTCRDLRAQLEQLSVLLQEETKRNSGREELLAQATARISEREESLNLMKSDLSAAEDRIASAEKRRDDLEALLTETRSMSEAQAAESQRRIAELECGLVEMSAERKTIVDEKLELSETVARLRAQLDEITSNHNVFVDTVTQLRSEVESVRAESDVLRGEKLDALAAIDDLKRSLEVAEVEHKALTDHLAGTRDLLERDLESSEHQNTVLRGEIAVERQRNQELQEIADAAEETNRKLFAALESVDEKVAEIESLKVSLEVTSRKNETLVNTVTELERKLSDGHVEALKERVAVAEAELREAKDDAEKQVAQVVAECEGNLKKIQKRYEERLKEKDNKLSRRDQDVAGFCIEMREMKRELDLLRASGRENEDASHAARASSVVVQRQLQEINRMSQEMKKLQAQIAYLEQSLKEERRRNEDGLRAGVIKSAAKRRSKSSHDLSLVFADEHMFDQSYEGPDRVEELKRRNSMYPHHMRSCYPLEDATQEQRENEVRLLNDSFWGQARAGGMSMDNRRPGLNDSLFSNAGRANASHDYERQPRETFAVPKNYHLAEDNRHVSSNSSMVFDFSPPKRSGSERGARKTWNKENRRM